MPKAQSLASAWPTRMPVAAQTALNATLTISLLQTTGREIVEGRDLEARLAPDLGDPLEQGLMPPVQRD